ncbi:hypothetical protein ACFVGN_21945 [Streptomyces sp. NPDC057757]|uniref:hypothetical protein n=1 Tax=Streptomyces sp. NPDC057757 TaxID=3346241 RepID=UPI0036B05C8B
MVVLPAGVTAPHPPDQAPRDASPAGPADVTSPAGPAGVTSPAGPAAVSAPAGPAAVTAPAGAPATPAPVPAPAGPAATPPPVPARSYPRAARHHPLLRLLPPALALLLAAPVLVAAHQARPTPYGDRITVHARVDGDPSPSVRTTEDAVEAYDEATGRPHWSYTREGHRPLAVVPARGDTIALWDDGLVTDTARGGGAVRWHRGLPGAAPWLAVSRGSGVLRPLGARMLAVVTPRRVAAYRIADGDLRWVLPARQGCGFAPSRAVRRGTALLIAQPCPVGDAADSWTGEIIAVDALGRITPDRTPLGNERHTP